MKSHSYKLVLLNTLILAACLSSCAKKVVIESDHRHPHVHHRHPHERPHAGTEVIIKP